MNIPLILFFIMVFIIVVVAIYGIQNYNIGENGEKYISELLRSNLPDEYRVVDNVTIENGKYTTQIDHVVVSPYGVFCIETKNLKGSIYGGAHSQHWTQNIWGNKYKVYNPLLQNEKHAQALNRLLSRFGDVFVFPITVFTHRCDLHVSCFEGSVLVYSDMLVSKILEFKQELLTTDEVDTIAGYIAIHEDYTLTDINEHVQNVVNAKLHSMHLQSQNICPRCGGVLIHRNGKYGTFLGCYNYPECKFTEKINN